MAGEDLHVRRRAAPSAGRHERLARAVPRRRSRIPAAALRHLREQAEPRQSLSFTRRDTGHGLVQYGAFSLPLRQPRHAVPAARACGPFSGHLPYLNYTESGTRGQMIYRRASAAGVRPHIAGHTGEAPAVTDQGIGQGIYRRDAMARLRLWMPSGQHVRPRPDHDLPGARCHRSQRKAAWAVTDAALTLTVPAADVRRRCLPKTAPPARGRGAE
jgi:hypothetical protein